MNQNRRLKARASAALAATLFAVLLSSCGQSGTGELAALADGATFKDCAECPEMVVIPAGFFSMGSPDAETGRRDWEGPVREVSIARFAVGRFEITFDEWDACVTAGGCPSREASAPVESKSTGMGVLDRLIQRSDAAAGDDAGWGRGRRPAINISWDDAQQYVAWLSTRSGHTYRLLSEAEWEYAARAGSAEAYWWGATPSRDHANYSPNDLNGDVVNAGVDQYQNTAPVGSFPANRFGIHDMNGNVREWTADCFIQSYEDAPTDGSARVQGECADRVTRGGAYNNPPDSVRSAARIGAKQDYRLSLFGFRVARTL